MVTTHVLVTGGAGFIGSYLVDQLLGRGLKVIVLDDLSSGFLENLQKHMKNPNFTFVQNSVTNIEVVMDISEKCSYIYHLAAFIPNEIGHVIKFSEASPSTDANITIKGAINVLEAAKTYGCKTLLASSGAVYGKKERQPIREEEDLNPTSHYGASKACVEMYVHAYHNLYDINAVIARVFNTYGPRQRKYVMYDVLRKLSLNSRKLTILGTGNQFRDFICVEDCAGILRLLNEQVQYGVYNVGTGIATSIKTVVKTICTKMGLDPCAEFTGTSWKGDVDVLVADISRLKSLGYKEFTSLDEGIEKLIQWFNREVI